MVKKEGSKQRVERWIAWTMLMMVKYGRGLQGVRSGFCMSVYISKL